MLTNLYWLISDRSPYLRRTFRWLGYNYLARRFEHNDWTFMNFGFADLNSQTARLDLRPIDEADRLHIQLYYRVAGAVPLEDRDVLEVGCGRGGGASYLMRYLHPRSMLGIDFSRWAIAFCTRRHVLPCLAFRVGDAEALPVADAMADAVVNVESSHCYASMGRFISEVWRVLRPGGYFLFADMRCRQAVPQLLAQLQASGLQVVDAEDITTRVLRALDLDSERRLARIRQEAPRMLRGILSLFVGIRGTKTYQVLHRGELVYLRYVLQKPSPLACDSSR